MSFFVERHILPFPITSSIVLNNIKVRDVCEIVYDYLLDKNVGSINSGILECGVSDVSMYKWSDFPISKIKIKQPSAIVDIILANDKYDDFVHLISKMINLNYWKRSENDKMASMLVSCILQTKGKKYVCYLAYLIDVVNKYNIDLHNIDYIGYNIYTTKYLLYTYNYYDWERCIAYSIKSLLFFYKIRTKYITQFVTWFICLESYDSCVESMEDYKKVHGVFIYCLNNFHEQIERIIVRYFENQNICKSIEMYNVICEKYKIKTQLDSYYNIAETRRIDDVNYYCSFIENDSIVYMNTILLKCYHNKISYSEAYDIVDNMVFTQDNIYMIHSIIGYCLGEPRFLCILTRRDDWIEYISNNFYTTCLCRKIEKYLNAMSKKMIIL